MNTLAPILRKNGFQYNLIAAGNKTFLYEQVYTKTLSYYEVFKKVIAKETTIAGNFIPEHIAFPSNEDFGKTAWTYRDENKALAKFTELEAVKTESK